MAINQNIEYATLLRCTAELNSEISADPTSISTRLLAQGFIPQLPPHSSPTAEDVVKQVTTKVKTFPNYFEAFISILSEFPWLQDIVKLIRKTYNELKLGQQGKLQDGAAASYISQCSIETAPQCEENQGLFIPKRKTKICSQHKKKRNYYCETCEVQICPDCISGEHSRHFYYLLVRPEAESKHGKNILSSLVPIEQEVEDLGVALGDVETRIMEVKGRGKRVREEVEEETLKISEAVKKRKEELLARVDELVKEKVTFLSGQRDKLEMLKTQASSCIEYAHKHLENDTEDESIETNINETMSKIQKVQKKPQQRADMHFESMKDFMTECQQYGRIIVNPADPKKCYAKSDAVRAAILNEETTIPIYTVNAEGTENIYTSTNTDVLTSTVVASNSIIPSRVIREEGTNESRVVFKSHARGANHVQVKVNKEDIQNIPLFIYVYTPIPTATIKVKSPNMLTVTGDKIVVVGDADDHINIYSRDDGEKITSFKLKGESKPSPRGVTTDDEFLYITDKINQCVIKYTLDGKFISSVGKKGKKQLEFSGRCGIATNKTGRIYIADQYNNRIQVLSSDFTFIHMFGTRGRQFGQFDQPRDVAVASDGTLYVTDTNNNRVQVFTANGEYIREFGDEHLYSPAGVCVDSNNHVVVSDHDNSRVCVFNHNGEFLLSFGSNGDGPGEFADLYGIAVDSDGKIYTADFGSHRVQIF